MINNNLFKSIYQNTCDVVPWLLLVYLCLKIWYLPSIRLFFFFKKIIIFIILTITLMIFITLIIASITLLERKVLSLSQRRVGPFYVGYKGRLQYIADALKLLLKLFIIPNKVNSYYFILPPILIFSTSYTFWINSVWGLNLVLIDIEYNIIFSLLLSSLFSIIILLSGFLSKNKYSLIASFRTAILTINLEITLGIFILILIFFSKSFSFLLFNYIQEKYLPLVFNFILLSGLVIILIFLETGRAPFDLHEAESELVSGYNIEYSSFYFALFYLGEYFHLFFFASFIAITLLGFIN